MRRNESQKIEFKEQWRDDALKTVCAFANTDGGIIYIGLDDKGRSVVLKDVKRLLEEIPNKIRDILGIVAGITVCKKAGKPAIKISIGKYTAPISYKGAFYLRSGSTTTELRGMELSRFLLSRGSTPWDSIVEPSASLQDISVKSLRRFQQLAKRRFPFIAHEKSVAQVLEKLNLTEKGRLKRAAILLFGKNPKKYFTSAFVQIGRFISESEVVSTDVVEGNLFEQVEKTLEILRLKYLENRFYYEGIYRKEDLIYPEDALREAVINAVIHRDYIGPHTQLRVYDNQLWLWNAGKLSGEISFEKLKKKHSSCPRNELLADVFFKAGFIEAWGRGTLRILDKCRENKLPEPEFSEMTGGFLLTFFKPKAGKAPDGKEGLNEGLSEGLNEGLNEGLKLLLDAVRAHPGIQAKNLVSLLEGRPLKTIERQVRRLIEKKLIERRGSRKTGGYYATAEK